jgi:glutamyl/glutaminyl-tRNA synthetase
LAKRLVELLGEEDSLVRTGSRGLFHLEPMIEVEAGEQRVAFGPVNCDEVELVCAAVASGDLTKHDKFLGPVTELDLMKNQTRFTMNRLGECHPTDLAGMKELGAYAGLATFDADSLMESLKATAAAREVKNKVLVMPARVACTGSKVGPSLYHLMEVLGQAEVLKRFDAALAGM